MAIISTHPPLAFAFGLLGNIISVLVFLAPVPTFVRIYRKKSTEGFHSVPYLVALFSSMLWLHYAMLKKDTFLLVTINAFGSVIETIYIVLYIIYASKGTRISTFKLLASLNIALFSFIILFTHFLIKGSIRVQVLGWICVTVAVCVFAAPLSIVAQVIRTKSVEFMPFNLSFFLTLSAVMWFGYGLTKKDVCVALPNVLGFILGLVQMALYAIYRKAQNVIMEEKFPEQLKTIVILSSEVHPDPENVKPKTQSEPESKLENEKAQEEEKEEENKKVNNEEKSLEKSDEGLNKSELAV